MNHTREYRAHQNAQKRVVERRQEAGKLRHICQRTDGLFHQLHAVHQDGKAHHDAAHIPAALFL